jgi:hypothetical protein
VSEDFSKSFPSSSKNIIKNVKLKTSRRGASYTTTRLLLSAGCLESKVISPFRYVPLLLFVVT